MRSSIVCILLAIGLVLAEDDAPYKAAFSTSRANSLFHRQLYGALTKENENLLFSSLSLHTVLSLLSQGAEGETLSLLTNALNATNADCKDGYKFIMSHLNKVDPSGGVILNMANKVYVSDMFKLKESFKSIATDNYFAEIEGTNFVDSSGSAQKINAWVESKTNNKIRDIIGKGDVDSMTRLILINAIYFKGQWAQKFSKANTKIDQFYTSETDTIQAPFMHQESYFEHAKVEELDAGVIQLPYTNQMFKLYVLLPNQRGGIRHLESKLSTFDFSTIKQKLRTVKAKLTMPKFKFESTQHLNEPLEKFGLKPLFSRADLGGLFEIKQDLHVSAIIQKAFIEVNEEGSEAAVASAVGVQGRSGRVYVPEEISFVADHPFIFCLVASKYVPNTGFLEVPLFTGKLAHP